MDCGSDASDTEAMILAEIQAEKEWGDATLSGGWKSTLDDVVIKPSMPVADGDREGLQRKQPFREVNRKSVSQQKDKVMREYTSHYNKA